MSAQAPLETDRPLVVHADPLGRFHVLHAGEAFAETAPIPREQIERNAAELRQQAMDEAAVLVARWSWNTALRCAAALRSGDRKEAGQLLKATTS